MRFRNLRIAFSITCGIACVLLIALWVRSYSIGTHASVQFTAHYVAEGISQRGYLGFLLIDPSIHGPIKSPALLNHEVHDFLPTSLDKPGWDFGIHSQSDRYVQFMIPWWSMMAPLAALVVVPWLPWIRWRFTLRTLLIATTLVAVVLGLAVWAAK